MTKAQDAKEMQGMCSVENTILESELQNSAKQREVTAIHVVEEKEGYYVFVKLRWALNKRWYIATRRNREAPKIWKDLGRLNRQLKELCPENKYLLHRKEPGEEELEAEEKVGLVEAAKAASDRSYEAPKEEEEKIREQIKIQEEAAREKAREIKEKAEEWGKEKKEKAEAEAKELKEAVREEIRDQKAAAREEIKDLRAAARKEIREKKAAAREAIRKEKGTIKKRKAGGKRKG